MNLDLISSNAENLPAQSRQEFCLALKVVRERQGISLAQIAAATKVPVSLFAALERCDLRRWPKGLFRRAFFRDYVRLIGVPVAETCEQFGRLFPEETSAPVTTVEGVAPDAESPEARSIADVRLVLDPAWHGPDASVRSRLLIAVLDAAAVFVLAAAVTRVVGLGLPSALAIVALAYFSVATALLGQSAAHWLMGSGRGLLDAMRNGTTATSGPGRPISAVLSSMFGGVSAGAHEVVDEPAMQPWSTDAHRVEPALDSQLRVRLKMSQ